MRTTLSLNELPIMIKFSNAKRLLLPALSLALCLPGYAASAETANAANSQPTPAVSVSKLGAGASAPLPSDSLYQLKLELTNQDGRELPLNSWQGQPVLVSMFYTSCEFVCPMLIEGIQATQAKLSATEREQVHVLMVSFDPARDTVTVLKQQTDQRQLDTKQWAMARTNPASARKLASALGIQYRALKNGDFNHTTAIILLDKDGRVRGRTTQLATADPKFVQLVKATLH